MTIESTWRVVFAGDERELTVRADSIDGCDPNAPPTLGVTCAFYLNGRVVAAVPRERLLYIEKVRDEV